MSDKEFRELFGFSEDYAAEDMNSGDDFIIPTRRPPVAKQLDAEWGINHREPDTNLISNTGAAGDSYRVTPVSEIPLEEFEQEYLKLFMREHNPLKVSQYLRDKVNARDRKRTASLWGQLSKERGLLGNYYVTRTPFKTCEEAKAFFNKFAKKAKILKKEASCEGCIHNQGKTCSLMGKYLFDEIPYTDKIANGLIRQISQENKDIPNFVGKIAGIKDPKSRIQAAYLQANSKEAVDKSLRYNISTYTGGYEETAPITTTAGKELDPRLLKMAVTQLIKKGASYESIVSKVASVTGTNAIKQIMPEAIRDVAAINTVKFANCSNTLKGNINFIIKDASCSTCIYHEGKYCGKYKASFLHEEKDRTAEFINNKFDEGKKADAKYVSAFIAQCIDSGVSLNQIKIALADKFETGFTSHLQEGVKKASKLSPYSFNTCKPNDFYTHVAKVTRDDNCLGCPANKGSYCASIKKAFVNPDKAVETVHVDTVPSTDIDITSIQSKVASVINKADVQKISTYLMGKGLKTDQVKQILKQAVLDNPVVNAVSLTDCKPSDLYKYAKSLLKQDKCGSCKDHKGVKCARFDKPFVQEKKNNALIVANKLKTATIKTNPVAVVKACIESGVSLEDIKTAFNLENFNTVFSKALKIAKRVSPVKLDGCSTNHYANVSSLYRSKGCDGCYFNAGSSCEKMKKSFTNPELVVERPLPMAATDTVKPTSKVAGIINNFTKVSESETLNALKMAGLNPGQVNKVISERVKTEMVNTYFLSSCTRSSLIAKMAGSIEKTSACESCVDNKEIKCARYNKSFGNTQISEKLYNDTDTDSEWFTHANGKPQMQVPDMNL